MTTEVWPLRFGLAATVEIADSDRVDAVVNERRGKPVAHGDLCACARCLDLERAKEHPGGEKRSL